MTPKQRMKAAAKRVARFRTNHMLADEGLAEAVLLAAYPELAAGTHVIVPMSILQGPGRDDKFVLVPREPTEAMNSAGVGYTRTGYEPGDAWEAMIAAYEAEQ